MISAANNILFSSCGPNNECSNELFQVNEKKRRRDDCMTQHDEAETSTDDTTQRRHEKMEEETHSSSSVMDDDSVFDTFFLHPTFSASREIMDVQQNSRMDENAFLDNFLTLSESDSSSSAVVDNSFIPDDLRTPYRTSRGKIPRLLKNDLRRFYPAMFANVLNSHDRNLIYPYLERFYVPDANLELLRDLSSVWEVNSDRNQVDSYKRPRGSLVTGRESLLTYFLLVFREFPDMCLSVKNIQVKRYNYSRKCQISFRLSLSWTHAVPKQSSTSSMPGESSVTDTTSPLYQSAADDASTIDVSPAHKMDEDSSAGDNSAHHEQEKVWETYAYEVEADDVLELNEDWYITQINSTTVSTSVRKTGEFTV